MRFPEEPTILDINLRVPRGGLRLPNGGSYCTGSHFRKGSITILPAFITKSCGPKTWDLSEHLPRHDNIGNLSDIDDAYFWV
jgi:hypothetical protein